MPKTFICRLVGLWQLRKWHKGGCVLPEDLPYYIRTKQINQIMEDDLFSEIQDSPGEIFDIPELRDLDEDKFDVNEYLNSNYDY